MKSGKEKRSISELMSLDNIALNQMVSEYPFSASLHTVLAKKNRQQGALAFEESLRQAAIRARSRAQMQKFIFEVDGEEDEIIDIIEKQTEPEEQVIPEEPKAESEIDKANDELSRLFISEAIAAGAGVDLIGTDLTGFEEVEGQDEEEDEFDKVEAVFPDSPLNPEELDQEDLSIPAQAASNLTNEEDIVETEDATEFAVNTQNAEISEEQKLQKTQEEEEEEEEEEILETPTPNPLSKARFSDWLSHMTPDNASTPEESRKQKETKQEGETEPQKRVQKWVHTEQKLEPKKEMQAPKRVSQEIISSFLANEEKIVPKRAEFFSAAKQAKLSLRDKDDIVSETLAKVYEGQAEYSKAISTYEKLSLLYPEKSSYFAALIEEVKKKQKQ